MADLVISIAVSVILILLLHGKLNLEMLILSIVAGFVSHSFTRLRNWKRIISIYSSLILNMPKAICEGLLILMFKTHETFVITKTEDSLKDVLRITLTPRSIAIFEDENGVHSHLLVKKKREVVR